MQNSINERYDYSNSVVNCGNSQRITWRQAPQGFSLGERHSLNKWIGAWLVNHKEVLGQTSSSWVVILRIIDDQRPTYFHERDLEVATAFFFLHLTCSCSLGSSVNDASEWHSKAFYSVSHCILEDGLKYRVHYNHKYLISIPKRDIRMASLNFT